ncbi:methionyl-tRNA formyltransferase [Candidatus Leptofilum sp.]|uniref:methionyl-tRNA formyltransferase n=1 Tax=Candidatus Leptofilum sp. TaxID=3241576 RepID=UPI003B59C418
MRVLFFGMLGSLTRRPLAALLATGVDLCGLVLPAEMVPPFELVDNGRSQTPITLIHPQPHIQNLLQSSQTASPLALAASFNVPAFAVRQLAAPETIATLLALQPDLICVSCFPHLLPPEILQLPRLGCLNVHPSLLPRFRGPAPLFWALRAGVAQTGVTIHFMDENFDTGDVVLQQPFPLPDGITHAELEAKLAQIGAELLVEAVQKLALGELSRQPQPAGFTSDPWPTDADFVLDLSWSARRAYNFMRGTMNWERPYFIEITGRRIWLETAVAYQPNAQQNEIVLQQGKTLFSQFSPGILQVVILSESSLVN